MNGARSFFTKMLYDHKEQNAKTSRELVDETEQHYNSHAFTHWKVGLQVLAIYSMQVLQIDASWSHD